MLSSVALLAAGYVLVVLVILGATLWFFGVYLLMLSAPVLAVGYVLVVLVFKLPSAIVLIVGVLPCDFLGFNFMLHGVTVINIGVYSTGYDPMDFICLFQLLTLIMVII